MKQFLFPGPYYKGNASQVLKNSTSVDEYTDNEFLENKFYMKNVEWMTDPLNMFASSLAPKRDQRTHNHLPMSSTSADTNFIQVLLVVQLTCPVCFSNAIPTMLDLARRYSRPRGTTDKINGVRDNPHQIHNAVNDEDGDSMMNGVTEEGEPEMAEKTEGLLRAGRVRLGIIVTAFEDFDINTRNNVQRWLFDTYHHTANQTVKRGSNGLGEGGHETLLPKRRHRTQLRLFDVGVSNSDDTSQNSVSAHYEENVEQLGSERRHHNAGPMRLPLQPLFGRTKDAFRARQLFYEKKRQQQEEGEGDVRSGSGEESGYTKDDERAEDEAEGYFSDLLAAGVAVGWDTPQRPTIASQRRLYSHLKTITHADQRLNEFEKEQLMRNIRSYIYGAEEGAQSSRHAEAELSQNGDKGSAHLTSGDNAERNGGELNISVTSQTSPTDIQSTQRLEYPVFERNRLQGTPTWVVVDGTGVELANANNIKTVEQLSDIIDWGLRHHLRLRDTFGVYPSQLYTDGELNRHSNTEKGIDELKRGGMRGMKVIGSGADWTGEAVAVPSPPPLQTHQQHHRKEPYQNALSSEDILRHVQELRAAHEAKMAAREALQQEQQFDDSANAVDPPLMSSKPKQAVSDRVDRPSDCGDDHSIGSTTNILPSCSHPRSVDGPHSTPLASDLFFSSITPSGVSYSLHRMSQASPLRSYSSALSLSSSTSSSLGLPASVLTVSAVAVLLASGAAVGVMVRSRRHKRRHRRRADPGAGVASFHITENLILLVDTKRKKSTRVIS